MRAKLLVNFLSVQEKYNRTQIDRAVSDAADKILGQKHIPEFSICITLLTKFIKKTLSACDQCAASSGRKKRRVIAAFCLVTIAKY